MESILSEWEVFARSLLVGQKMTALALRDHAEGILLATVQDMRAEQSPMERSKKSRGQGHGEEHGEALDGASEMHAIGRLGSGFDLLEVVSEYRALRASVLQLWRDSDPKADDRSIDELTRFNESIDQSLAKAVSSYTKRVDQSRDMFLAILSHDLRNPLHSITMSSEILRYAGSPGSDTVGYADQISTSASVMGRMISDLLDYTRTRLGAGMPVSPSPMNLGNLGRELFNEFHSAHPNRAIDFHSNGELEGTWDYDRIRQAISNIVGNAIQHGADNVAVELSVSGEIDEVVVVVHNGGPAIPPGELSKIFNPLVRGSSAEHPKKNRPGSIGLGLYIAREIAKSHGGNISVTSSDSAGTSFTVRLPRLPFPGPARPILDEEHIRTM